MKYSGILPPIVTPFDERGEIQEDLIRREMRLCMDSGADGLSVGGSTGEGPTLRDEELASLIGIAKDYVGADQPVICGVMRACTRDAVRTGLAARKAGADAIMVTPTAYNVLVPNEDGMYHFYKTLSEEVGLPIIIYNVIPQNTISPVLFHRLVCDTDNVMGIKQSVGGIQALYADLLEVGDAARVFAATDEMIFSCFELGAAGGISAILSMFPKESKAMWRCAQNGDHAGGMKIQNALYKKWMCLAGNQFPIRMKYALRVLGRDMGQCRSPITTLPDAEKRRIRQAFEA